MSIAYLDCFSGIAGDMLLAALVDAGLPLDSLNRMIAALRLEGVSVAAEKVKRGGLAATHVRVVIDSAAPRKHRHLSHILRIIDAADLPAGVKERSSSVFCRLAEAEALVHNSTVEKVHFHEVGADDAIVDIVGACLGLDHFGVTRVECSPIPTGSGTVQCEHGLMPIPAPATAHLLRGAPIASTDEPGELTTPTGAAIATTLAAAYGPPPAMTLRSIGVGTGTREGKTRPNIFRILIGDAATGDADTSDVVAVLETQIDDADGQTVAFALQQTLAAGALDAYAVPIMMKKGRCGQLLTVLCRPGEESRIEQVLFAETGTLGVRRTEARRTKLAREIVAVETRYGPIRVKLGCGASLSSVRPEYEDCAAAARRTGVAFREIQREALRAWESANDPGGRR